MIQHTKKLALLMLVGTISACGTTYQLPELGDAHQHQASAMFASAQQDSTRSIISANAAERRFKRVSPRVSAVGKTYCEALTAGKSVDCNVDVGIDRELQQRNAYFTYVNDKPVIRLSLPLIQDTASDDEMAFVIGHEYGHLIGQHIEKQEQQALVGALILGTLTAAANSYSASYGGQYDQAAVNQSVEAGAAFGTKAFSQEYELESDTLGTRIAAAAGYDPVQGAMFFARPEAAKTSAGQLSFWGTHPPDEKRLATVIATNEEIQANVGLRRAKSASP